MTLEDRRQDELQDHDETDHDPTQRGEAAPAAEQHDGDREDSRQPDQRGPALAVGVGVPEAGIGAALIGEDDPIAAAEIGVGRCIEREGERLAAALVRPLGQPHVGEVAGDPFRCSRSGARAGVQPNDLRFVNLAREKARYGRFHVRAESDHEHPHDHEQREPEAENPQHPARPRGDVEVMGMGSVRGPVGRLRVRRVRMPVRRPGRHPFSVVDAPATDADGQSRARG